MKNVTRFVDSSYFVKRIRSQTTIGFRSKKPGFGFFKKCLVFRLGSLFDHSLRSIVISLIGGYQRHLSPRKGYSCAHRVAYGSQSCSEYVKNVLTDKSLFESTFLARQRFRDCNIASVSLKSQASQSRGSVDIDGDCCGIIAGIITAIVALLFGKNNGCCK